MSERKMLPCSRCGYDPSHLHTVSECLDRVTSQLTDARAILVTLASVVIAATGQFKHDGEYRTTEGWIEYMAKRLGQVDGWRVRGWDHGAEEACDAIADAVGIDSYDWDWPGLRDAVSNVVYELEQERLANKTLAMELEARKKAPPDFCHNAKGGTPGNENVIRGKVVCDYCSVILSDMDEVSDKQIEVMGSEHDEYEAQARRRIAELERELRDWQGMHHTAGASDMRERAAQEMELALDDPKFAARIRAIPLTSPAPAAEADRCTCGRFGELPRGRWRHADDCPLSKSEPSQAAEDARGNK